MTRTAPLCLLLALAGCSGPAPEPTLADLIVERLALMPAVAAAKRADGKPVGDPAREAELLARVEEQARSRGLDPAEARRLFADQIDAAKHYQRHLLETGAPLVQKPLSETRAAIDALTPRLLDALAAWGKLTERDRKYAASHARARLAARGVPADAVGAALSRLGNAAGAKR